MSWLVLLVAIVVCPVAFQMKEPLTNGLLLADPTNCSGYYEFVPQLKYCPQGLVFNSKRQTCDWPANVNCSCKGGVEDSGTGGGNSEENGGSAGNGGGGGGGGEDNNVDTGGSGCLTRGKCPAVDPLEYTVHLPHQSDCNLFCRCDHGLPKVDRCPTGLHFNSRLQICDSPQSAGCVDGGAVTGCQRLSNNNRGHWEPETCVTNPIRVGDNCSLVCKSEYQLSGSANITCMKAGWSGAMGINQIPLCKTVNEIGEELASTVNETQKKNNNLLFILDESGSVGSKNFNIELSFVKAVVGAFPLSRARSAGVITFSSRAAVDISIRESDTCTFLRQVEGIRYSSGGTDILRALNLAYYEIMEHAIHNVTLVFLITDGISTTDPTSGADKIKGHGDILFTVGVAGYDEKQLAPLSSLDKKNTPLFYGIKNFKVFSDVANYLSTKYNGTATKC